MKPMLNLAVILAGAAVALNADAQLMNDPTKALLEKAKEAKWERITVKNHAGVVAHVRFEETTIDPHECPKSPPKPSHRRGGCDPAIVHTVGKTYSEDHNLALGQTWTDNFDITHKKVKVIVYADLWDGAPRCLDNYLDGTSKEITFTMSGTASKKDFKCGRTDK